MGFGHGQFGHFDFGRTMIVVVRVRGLVVRGFKAVLSFNKPTTPFGFKATVVE